MKLIFLNNSQILLFVALIFGCSHSTSWTTVHGGGNVGSILGSIYFFDGQSGLLSTTFELYRTSDGGRTLELVDKLPEMTLDSIYFDTQGNGWIVGTENRSPIILRTGDRGETWETVVVEADPKGELNNLGFTRFYDVCFGDNGRGWVAGDKGVVGVLFENNRLMASSSFYVPNSIFSVTCVGTKSYAAGQQGTILSYNGQWTKETLDPEVTFTRIKIIDYYIWVVGGNSRKGVVFSKSESGDNWSDRSPRTSSILFDIAPKNQQILLAGADGILLVTSDLGGSWNSLALPTQGDLSRIFCTDSTCWIIGDRMSILRSENYQK